MFENTRATIAAGIIGTSLASGIDRSSTQKELSQNEPQIENSQIVSTTGQKSPGLQKMTDNLLVTSLEINKAVFAINPKLYEDPKVKEFMEQFKQQKPDYDGNSPNTSHLRATEALLITSIELNRLFMSENPEIFKTPQIKKLMHTLSEQKKEYDGRKQD